MRLFFAVDIPSEIKSEIVKIRRQLGSDDRRVKWVEERNLHLTMKFLGEVPRERVEQIIAKVGSCMQGLRPFDLRVSVPGFFPNARNPRVVWLGIDGETEKAQDLGRRIDCALITEGFEQDLKRRLHLTIGRINENSVVPPLVKWANSTKTAPYMDDFVVQEFVLYSSELTRQGPIYSIIEKFTFTS